MTTNQAMTAGAVAFAAFALWYITRKPGQALSVQPGQAQRDAGLAAFVNQLREQAAEIEGTSYALSREQFASLLGNQR